MRLPGILRARAGSLTTDSMSLIATSGLTAVVGIGFWALAARLIAPDVLGIETALLSLMTTAGMIAALGPGNALTAMLPTSKIADRPRHIRIGVLTVVIVAVGAGAVAGIAASVTIRGAHAESTIPYVIIGTVVMAFFSMKDAVLTALSAARFLPPVNLASGVAKMALLPAFIFFAVPDAAVSTTLVTSAIALLVVWVFMLPRVIDLQSPGAQFERVHETAAFLRFSIRDGAASVVSMGTVAGAPFLATWLAGPAQGAMVALMLPLSNGPDFVTIGNSTALLKHLTTSPNPRALILKVWWTTQALVAAIAVVLLFVVSPVLLRVFGENYDRRTLWAILGLLAVGSVARVSFLIWESVLRATLQIRVLLINNLCVSVAMVPILILATLRWGAIGTAGALAVNAVLMSAAGVVGLRRILKHLKESDLTGTCGHGPEVGAAVA